MVESRKLAAILAADVVGFSRLTGADEDRTLARLRALRSDLIDPTIAVHAGRVVKRTGDGAIVEFRSVVDAVRCAIEIQNSMIERNVGLRQEQRIEFRIGIHLGDVVEESDGDLMGDGVNIAARLQAVAQPRAICLSEDAYRQVRSRLNLAISDLGETLLKNIADPVHVYSVQFGNGIVKAAALGDAISNVPALSSPDKPSIAVLPFQNMSGDPEQVYFADGIVEEIITALSHFRWLSVIARNSSFTYKGKSVDVKQIGRELGARYVLEGSVRKSGDRVRITGQMIDASTGTHLWADRFDGALEDIFDLQDCVTAKVVGEIAPRLEQVEIDRAKRKQTENLDAYDYYLRGLASLHEWTRDSNTEALRLFFRANELDPSFASAYGLAAMCYVWRKVNGWIVDPTQEVAEAERLGRLAVEFGPDDAVALSGGGYALVFVAHDLNDGPAFIERALALNPNLAWALFSSGWTKAFLGDPEGAIAQLTRAILLSPLDPHGFRAKGGIAFAHFLASRYEEAITWAEAALRQRPTYLASIRDLAAANALAGRIPDAQKAMSRLRKLDPAKRVSAVKDWVPLRRPDDLKRLEEGLRRAGLPE
ncbi:adenylate/guanylate cyclase domain-containing protein [Bradyrhizobium sp. LLZ17]|uniref:Adenylate/guanylate cyclase domain-containing protein n=1 Tax=Bradyrhizobium sp. LLZ17 TaxID=3239388 RepID=A0AB39XKC9_9BRAD